MTATIPPTPRPKRRMAQSPISPLLSPFRLSNDAPRRTVPTGLISPLKLLPSLPLPEPKPLVSRVPPACIATKRRRVPANPATRTRRRHCARTDCCISYCTAGPTMLDQLPWLSHAKDAPQRADDLFNVPDLSRLPRQQQSCSRVGPVRNRKAPLRPDPISYSIPVATRNGSTPGTPRRSSPIPLLPLQDRELLDPRTPPPRETLYPEGIRFFNLMPILSLDDTLARY